MWLQRANCPGRQTYIYISVPQRAEEIHLSELMRLWRSNKGPFPHHTDFNFISFFFFASGSLSKEPGRNSHLNGKLSNPRFTLFMTRELSVQDHCFDEISCLSEMCGHRKVLCTLKGRWTVQEEGRLGYTNYFLPFFPPHVKSTEGFSVDK